jgi:hypothetical protein
VPRCDSVRWLRWPRALFIFYRLTDQPSGVAWQIHDGREQVQIAIFDPQLLARDQNITPAVPADGLIYEELLVAYPPASDTDH